MSDHTSRILALDMGTSSVRALVCDARARPLPGLLARRKTTVTVGADGAATINPADYLTGLVECLDELSEAGHLDGVSLVAASAQWHSVLPLAAEGSPLGPVLTWLDNRSQPAELSVGPVDREAFHLRTGTWWHGLYWTVRLPWLREHLGASVAARFVGLPEYLFGVLLDGAAGAGGAGGAGGRPVGRGASAGGVPMSISQASGTGLLDLRRLDWDVEACELAGVRPGELPELGPPDWRGRLRREYARRWPALRDAAWTAPVGDGAASNIGSGGATADRAVVTVGTSAAVRLVQPSSPGAPLPPLPAGLWRYRVDHQRIVTGTAYSNGGNLYAWARRELRLPDGPELEEALGRAATHRQVAADPRFGGDRPPGRTPAGSGELRGLGFATTAVDLLAALLGAVCRQVARDLTELESTLDAPPSVPVSAPPSALVSVALGGGAVAASAWWRREFRASLAPRQVVDVAQPEVGATGAALIVTGQAG